MDNLTHSLFAGSLARTRLGRRSPLSAVALVVSANVPDLDIVVQLWAGMPGYLLHHRGFTHSFVGLALQAVLLTVLFTVLERRRGAPPALRAGPGLAVVAGLASHFFLDALNTYGVRPLLPFDGSWHCGDLAFIVDPWLWLFFGAPAVLMGRRSRRGDVLWGVLGLVTAALVVLEPVLELHAHPTPLAVRIGYPAGVVLLTLMRARSRGKSTVLVACTIVVALYFATILHGRARAERIAADVVQERAPEARHALSAPHLANHYAWTVILGDSENWHAVDVRGGGARDVRLADRRAFMEFLPPIEDTPEVRAWRDFARAPFLRIDRTEEGTFLRLLDLRYVDPDGSSWCELRVRLDASASEH